MLDEHEHWQAPFERHDVRLRSSAGPDSEGPHGSLNCGESTCDYMRAESRRMSGQFERHKNAYTLTRQVTRVTVYWAVHELGLSQSCVMSVRPRWYVDACRIAEHPSSSAKWIAGASSGKARARGFWLKGWSYAPKMYVVCFLALISISASRLSQVCPSPAG